MRLQLHIQRYSLPPVQIIHTTGSGPASHTKSPNSTVADLLNDVNDLVPLESADGEWGLEDYAVEVAATADQESTYECLHFQKCEAVLREDDEVIIRPLSNEDLRIRRLGSRHQITGDGRHLIDGIPFGKQWLRKTTRPSITIPPRKKRRLEIEEEPTHGEDEALRILPASDDHSKVLVTLDRQDEDDDEEDEDYVDHEEDGEQNDLQIAIREVFDDADVDTEDDNDESDDREPRNGLEDLPSEVQQLLEDAAELAEVGSAASAHGVVQKQLKRKREVDDEGDKYDDDSFEGFSTPVKSFAQTVLRREDESDDNEAEDSDDVETSSSGSDNDGETQDDMVEDSSDSDDPEGSGSTSSSDSDADSMMEQITIEQAKKRALNLVKLSEEDTSDSDTDSKVSSFDGKEEHADQDTTSSSAASDDSDSDDSGSGLETSSSSESEEDSKEKDISGIAAETLAVPSATIQKTQAAAEKALQHSPVAPGMGLKRTHDNNARNARRKKLTRLKEQGILSPEADFKALMAYEASQGQTPIHDPTTDQSTQVAQRGEVAEDVPVVNNNIPVTVDDTKPQVAQLPSEASLPPATDANVETVDAGFHTSHSQSTAEPAPKRSKLDIAATRRMLFSSLGVRNPKTPAAEKALREKLSKLAKPLKQAENSINNHEPEADTTVDNDDSWKDKLVVSAVECEEVGVTLPPPPFPFQQAWARGPSNKNKRRARDDSQYYQGYDLGEKNRQENTTLSYGDEQSEPRVKESTTADSPEEDDMHIPESFDGLQDLEQSSAQPGAVIAYKELHLDESTNYQPEVSIYKVGKITDADNDGIIYLALAKRFHNERKYDDVTGERIYGKFEIHNDVKDQSDNGEREIPFSAMIAPKLVKATTVEVPESSHVNGLRGGGEEEELNSQPDGRFTMIPESAGQSLEGHELTKPIVSIEHIEVSTPRRNEITTIIKEAGFDSALGDQLLQPLTSPARSIQHDKEQSGVPSTSQDEFPQRFRQMSPRLNEARSQGPSLEMNMKDPQEAVTSAMGLQLDSELAPSSSPFMHTQETVEYPHISQIEINSSEPPKTSHGSSHQDAQRISPAPNLEVSFTLSAHNGNGGSVATDSQVNDTHHDHEQDEPTRQPLLPQSLASEVPQSPSQNQPTTSQEVPAVAEESPPGMDSFLGGRGYDGHISSYLEHESSDDDLPSIQEIVSSSQQHKNPSRSTSTARGVSPPPLKTSTRKTTASKKRKSTPPASSPDLPDMRPAESSRTIVKISASQRQTRLSQVPAAGSQVIDLTLNSDVPSPRDTENGSGNNDGDFVPSGSRSTRSVKRDLHFVAGGGKTVSDRISSDTQSQTQTQTQASGVGTRRLLTKKRSYV